jgi:NADH:ubiquinone reductase (non-electrogenic)
VAERQAKYLAKSLNNLAKQGGGHAGKGTGADIALGKPFVYKHMGSMASVGNYKALVDLRENKVSLDVL